MADTVVGLFRSRLEADQALRKLKQAGYGSDRVSVVMPARSRRGHYGRKVTLGIAIGTVLGALLGAVATGMVPGVHPLIPGNLVATFLFAAVAGAVTGGVAGALFSMAASGDALYYEQEVESGRVLVRVVGPNLEHAADVMREAGAMEAAPAEAPLDTAPAERPRPESG